MRAKKDERAIFIGEELFHLRIDAEETEDSGGMLWKNRNRFHLLIGGTPLRVDNYTKWLSSPDGLAAVENAMIERGFRIWGGHVLLTPSRTGWAFDFSRNGARYESPHESKAEAILGAVEKALLTDRRPPLSKNPGPSLSQTYEGGGAARFRSSQKF